MNEIPPSQFPQQLQPEVPASQATALEPTPPAVPGPSALRTRIGKIARLPLPIREQLNHRLLDNEPAPSLVSWLNSLPEVQTMLAELFAGRPIIDQSIYEWKQGGFADWVAQQSSLAQVWSLAEQVRELDPSK